MSDWNGKKAGSGAVALGYVSLALSVLGILGGILVLISALLPGSNSRSASIQSEDVRRAVLLFVGAGGALCLAPVGGIMGLVSLIRMLVKSGPRKLWLPIAAIAGSIAGFLLAIFSMAYGFS